MSDEPATPVKTGDPVADERDPSPPSPETEHIRDEGEPLGGNVA